MQIISMILNKSFIVISHWLSPHSEIVIDIILSTSRVLDLELNVLVMSSNFLLQKKGSMTEKVISLSATIHPAAQGINLKFIFYFFLPTSHASFPSPKSCSFLSISTPVQKSINSQFIHYISNFCLESCIFNPKSSECPLKNIITTCQSYVSTLPNFSLKTPNHRPSRICPLLPAWLHLVFPFFLSTFSHTILDTKGLILNSGKTIASAWNDFCSQIYSSLAACHLLLSENFPNQPTPLTPHPYSSHFSFICSVLHSIYWGCC